MTEARQNDAELGAVAGDALTAMENVADEATRRLEGRRRGGTSRDVFASDVNTLVDGAADRALASVAQAGHHVSRALSVLTNRPLVARVSGMGNAAGEAGGRENGCGGFGGW